MAERKFCPYCMSPLKDGEACPVCGLTEGSYEPKPHHLPPGTVLIDKYLVGRVLGEGGFGITYIGCDLRLEMKVAIKELFPSERVTRVASSSLDVTSFSGTSTELFGKLKEKFLHEARMMARMVGQPEIVTVRDFFEANNTAYIVMEYIEGTTLKELVDQRGGHIPAGELLHIIEPLFGALSAMHDIGLIHRDIKPENLMLSSGKIRLLDFGCARENVIGKQTITIILSPGYAPISQYQGHNMGPWTDVYSLAATMYFCLTGKQPPQSMDRMIEEELIPPRQLGAALTVPQECALYYAMGLRPQHRFQSMREFHAGLYEGVLPKEARAMYKKWIDPKADPNPILQEDASLAALKIGSLELSPAFDPKVTNYTAAAAATEAESEITAMPSDPHAKATLKLKGQTVKSPVKWDNGKNNLRIRVQNGSTEKIYTVAVNKRIDRKHWWEDIPIWSRILLGIAAVILITVLILANRVEPPGPDTKVPSTEPTIEVTEETTEPATEPSTLGILASGVCAKNLSWALDDDGTLTVSGTGDMYHFAGDKAPWYDYRDSIQKVVIESGVTSVSDHAFYSCHNLTAVELPDTLVSIEASAFYETSLAAVTIPASVTSIGEAAFSDCLMEEIVVADGNSTYISVDGVLFNKDMTTLLCYPGGKAGNYTVPDSVTYIAGAAFDGCESLATLIMKEGLTEIGECAFEGCSRLTHVVIPEGVTTIPESAFLSDGALSSITLPATLTSVMSKAFMECDSLTFVYYNGMQENREGIIISSGNECLTNATWYCDYATSGTCGENLTWALDNGTLTVSGSGEMTEYSSGSSPWYDARGVITSVVIGDGVTTVGDYAFYGCAKLTSVSLPDSVTELGTSAFGQCTGLTAFTVPDSVATLGGYVFNGCESLTEIRLPINVSVGYGAFSKCEALRDVYVKAEENHVVIQAKNNCLKDATWHYDYLTVGTFGDNLTWTLDTGGTLTVSGADAMPDQGSAKDVPWYDYRKKITKVVLEDGITSIGERAFYKCIKLTNVTIPESVKTVGTFAFYGDKELTAVHYGGSELNRLDALEIGSNNEPLTDAAWDYAKASNEDKLLAKKTELLFTDAYTLASGDSTEEFIAALNNDSVSSIIIPEGSWVDPYDQLTITKPVMIDNFFSAHDTITVSGENACIYIKGESELDIASVLRTVNGGRVIVDGQFNGGSTGAVWLESDSDLTVLETATPPVGLQDNQMVTCSERELRSNGTEVSTEEEFTAAINRWNTKTVIVTGDITVDAGGADLLYVPVPIIIDKGASLTITNTENENGWSAYLYLDSTSLLNYGTLNAFVNTAHNENCIVVNEGTWTGGMFNGNAILVNYGSMTFTQTNSGVNGDAPCIDGTLGQTGHFFNEGTLTVTGSFHFGDGILCNCSLGTIVVNGDFSLSSGVDAFNYGSIQVANGGNIWSSALLDNYGGKLEIAFNGCFENKGILLNQQGGNVHSAGTISNDSLILNSGSSFSATNQLGGRVETMETEGWAYVSTIEELTVALNDPSVSGVTVWQADGWLNFSGSLTVTKPLVLYSSLISNGGSLGGLIVEEDGYVVAWPGTSTYVHNIELADGTFFVSCGNLSIGNVTVEENAAFYCAYPAYGARGNEWYYFNLGQLEISGGMAQILSPFTLKGTEITVNGGGTLQAQGYVTFDGCTVEVAENSLLSLDAYWMDETTIVTNNGYMDLNQGSETDFRMEGKLTNNGTMLISRMWVYGVLENNGRIYFSNSNADRFTTKDSGKITGNAILAYTDGTDWKNG